MMNGESNNNEVPKTEKEARMKIPSLYRKLKLCEFEPVDAATNVIIFKGEVSVIDAMLKEMDLHYGARIHKNRSLTRTGNEDLNQTKDNLEKNTSENQNVCLNNRENDGREDSQRFTIEHQLLAQQDNFTIVQPSESHNQVELQQQLESNYMFNSNHFSIIERYITANNRSLEYNQDHLSGQFSYNEAITPSSQLDSNYSLPTDQYQHGFSNKVYQQPPQSESTYNLPSTQLQQASISPHDFRHHQSSGISQCHQLNYSNQFDLLSQQLRSSQSPEASHYQTTGYSSCHPLDVRPPQQLESNNGQQDNTFNRNNISEIFDFANPIEFENEVNQKLSLQSQDYFTRPYQSPPFNQRNVAPLSTSEQKQEDFNSIEQYEFNNPQNLFIGHSEVSSNHMHDSYTQYESHYPVDTSLFFESNQITTSTPKFESNNCLANSSHQGDYNHSNIVASSEQFIPNNHPVDPPQQFGCKQDNLDDISPTLECNYHPDTSLKQFEYFQTNTSASILNLNHNSPTVSSPQSFENNENNMVTSSPNFKSKDSLNSDCNLKFETTSVSISNNEDNSIKTNLIKSRLKKKRHLNLEGADSSSEYSSPQKPKRKKKTKKQSELPIDDNKIAQNRNNYESLSVSVRRSGRKRSKCEANSKLVPNSETKIKKEELEKSSNNQSLNDNDSSKSSKPRKKYVVIKKKYADIKFVEEGASILSAWEGCYDAPSCNTLLPVSMEQEQAWQKIIDNEKWVQCPNESCTKTYISALGLSYHYVRCQIDRVWKCRLCEYTSTSPKLTKQHLHGKHKDSQLKPLSIVLESSREDASLFQ